MSRKKIGYRTGRTFLLILAIVVTGLGPRAEQRSSFINNAAELTIVHFTDTHLSTLSREAKKTKTPWTHKFSVDGYKLHHKVLGRSKALLEKAVRVTNRIIKPDVVILTGDVVDKAHDRRAFKEAAAQLNRIDAPVLLVQGEHDASDNNNYYHTFFGDFNRTKRIKGFRFFLLPQKPDENRLQNLEEKLADPDARSPLILATHRMLYTSTLMKTLSNLYTSASLVPPRREAILRTLNRARKPILVLCGHSHTNYRECRDNIHLLSTSSLVEYPHELRLIKIGENGRIRTRLYPLSEFSSEEELQN